MQSFYVFCRFNFLCAVVTQPAYFFIGVVNVFLFVLNPCSTVPDFIFFFPKQYVGDYDSIFCHYFPVVHCLNLLVIHIRMSAQIQHLSLPATVIADC